MLVAANKEHYLCDFNGARCGEKASRTDVALKIGDESTIVTAIDVCEKHRGMLHECLHLATLTFIARRRKPRRPREEKMNDV